MVFILRVDCIMFEKEFLCYLCYLKALILIYFMDQINASLARSALFWPEWSIAIS